MTQENTAVIYDREWLRSLVNELYIANDFAIVLLETIRQKSNTYHLRTEMVGKLLELEGKVPKLEKLADAEKLFRDSIQNIRHSESALSSARADLKSLVSSISNSLRLFDPAFRSRIYPQLQDQ